MNYKEMTMEEYDGEVTRQPWRRRLLAAGKFAADALALAAALALAWCLVFLTPPQMSGEYDWAYEAGKSAGLCE